MSKKLIVFDVDGVLLDNKMGGFKDVLVVLGKEEQVEEIDREYQRRKHRGPWGIKELGKLYQDTSQGKLRQIAQDYCEKNLVKGAKRAIEMLQKQGFVIGSLSSNPQFIMDTLKELLGLEFAEGTQLKFKDNTATGKIQRKIDRYGKARLLKQKIQEISVSPQQTVVVGDSITDLSMADIAGVFIAFCAKPEAKQRADLVVEEKNLELIPKMLKESIIERPVNLWSAVYEKLVGILTLPIRKEKLPAVLIAHGFKESKSKRALVELARGLAQNGIASLRFDFSGHGDSGGSFEDLSITKQVKELKIAYDFLAEQSRIDPSKIFVLGHSLGALITGVFQSQEKSASGLILVSPAFHQRELIKNWHTKKEINQWQNKGYLDTPKGRIGQQYLQQVQNTDWSETASNIKVPILIIHGREDDDVPLKFAEDLYQKVQSTQKKLEVVEVEDHSFESRKGKDVLVKLCSEWIRKHFQPLG